MQIFEKLVETLPRDEVAFFRSWLYTLTRNHCLMELRSRKGRYFEEIQVNLMETDGHLHQEEGPEFETNMSNLEKCIEELAIEQKRCVQLFYLQQKCYREISEVTGYDGNKVRNLKICMERHERY
jgi:RNA polymerase sigma factor (sigma-70 family)